MDYISAFDGPAIVAGDLNTFTSKYLRRAASILSEYNFQLADPIHDPRSRVKRLDHLFTRGMQVSAVEISTGIYSSDHLPIIANAHIL